MIHIPLVTSVLTFLGSQINDVVYELYMHL